MPLNCKYAWTMCKLREKYTIYMVKTKTKHLFKNIYNKCIIKKIN